MSKITIKRAPRDGLNPYYQGRRKTAQDRRLSYEARGVLAYLLSQPPDWELKVDNLILSGDDGEAKCGRDKIYRILDELTLAGYVEKPQRVQGEKGRWTWTSWLVSETPNTDLPDSDALSPNTGLPNTENPDSKIRESQQKKESASSDAGATAFMDKEQRESNYKTLFSSVASHVFKINNDHQPDPKKSQNSMIGAIASWLNGQKDRQGKIVVGYISAPARPEHVKTFVEDYELEHRRNGRDLPTNFERFVNAWRAWASAKAAEDAKWNRS